jgi:hypothetical protein
MANIANVKVKSGNVLELSGSSVSISGSGGLNLHTQNGGIVADAGTGKIELTASSGVGIDGNLVVQGNITAERLDIVETTVSSSILFESGSTRFGNDSLDNHQFTGSVLVSGSVTIEAGSGQYNGSGAGLTNIPNSALSGSGAITINGASTALGDSITTVAASDGLTSSTTGGTVTLEVSASGTDSGLVVDGTGVKVDNTTVARLNANANFGSNNVSASYVSASSGFVGDGSALTNLTADNLAGTIPDGVLGNSSLFVGTTEVALNRSSAALTLEDVSVSGSFMSASVEVKGAAAEFGTLTLANDLAIAHGGTGLSTAPTQGKLLIGQDDGTYVVGQLASSGGTVNINTTTSGTIDLSVSLGAISAAGTDDANNFTAHNTFNSISVTGSAGLTLTSDAPLVASGSVEFKGSVRTNVRTVTADASLASDDNVILAQPSADLKITLTAGADGRQLVVKKINEDTNRLYLSGSGCQIDGANEFDMYGPLQSVNLVSSGSNWFVL